MGLLICDLCNRELKKYQREYGRTGRHWQCETDRRKKQKQYNDSLKHRKLSR